MKKMLALFLAICLVAACLTVVPVAAADETLFYVVQEGQEVYLEYAKPDNATYSWKIARLLLPVGYTFSSAGKAEGGKIKVTYCGLTKGFIYETDWDKLTVSPSEKALPEIAVKVDDHYLFRYVAEGNNAGRIEPDGSIAADVKLTYLGEYTYNNTLYYAVEQEGREGVFYTLASHSNATEINAVLHPDTGTSIISTPEVGADKTADKKDGGFTWVRFVLILGIIVPLITIILMIVRPGASRRRAHREIYEGDDDYDGIDEV